MPVELAPPRPIETRPEFARILRRDETYSSGRSGDVGDRVNGWFDTLMIQSGMETSPPVVLLSCLLGTIGVGGLVFVLQENLLTAALGGLFGFCLPVLAAMIARGRRQRKMLDQMPGMVEELARAARTGRSLEQCLHMVADDTPAPLGRELKLCSRKLRLGLSLDAALRELPHRTGLVSLNVLVMALSVHQQAGGDLVHVLERLSRTIRDRIHFLGRLKVATTASRATAVLMLVLPPAILAFFTFRDPEYLSRLMNSSPGQATIFIAIGLQLIGSAWVLRILKTSQRT